MMSFGVFCAHASDLYLQACSREVDSPQVVANTEVA
jgi:hypothetical protein